MFKKEKTFQNNKNVNTGNNNGHIGDNYLVVNKYGEYEKKIAKLCLQVLKKMTSNGNQITPEEIKEICGDERNNVMSSLSKNLSYHAQAGYEGIPKTKKKNIDKAIAYYREIING